jgi:excisionase family DNA binding protein
MNNGYPEDGLSSGLSVSETEEAAIRERADRAGKDIGEAVSRFLAEIMIAIVAARPQAVSARLQATSQRPQRAVAQDPNGILKASDVAQLLGISKALAYRLMQQGEIPVIQFGRTTRVKRQDLEEFIRTHRK